MALRGGSAASFYDPGYGYHVCMSQYTRTIISALLVEKAYPVVSATLWLLYSFVVLKLHKIFRDVRGR